ncbi:MAG TPA: uracil-DNA glycosylase family protein [Isosphaeraceae bacterium]|nr:uracil-DNA glycosylase family protein [Isosphaeraceae bacterium]
MNTMEHLLAAIEREARRAGFPVDKHAYAKAGRDPGVPILCAGSLAASVCVFGRDLGAEEVLHGEPLVGAAGRMVRAGVYQACLRETPARDDRRMAKALAHTLLTNTVPFKPPGNRAYASEVKERFRPFVAELLASHWAGNHVITLGTEAFRWFVQYADAAAAEALWARPDRYEADLLCVITVDRDGAAPLRKEIKVSPLPHPSPLNTRWYKQFPGLLAKRLEAVGAAAH